MPELSPPLRFELSSELSRFSLTDGLGVIGNHRAHCGRLSGPLSLEDCHQAFSSSLSPRVIARRNSYPKNIRTLTIPRYIHLASASCGKQQSQRMPALGWWGVLLIRQSPLFCLALLLAPLGMRQGIFVRWIVSVFPSDHPRNQKSIGRRGFRVRLLFHTNRGRSNLVRRESYGSQWTPF